MSVTIIIIVPPCCGYSQLESAPVSPVLLTRFLQKRQRRSQKKLLFIIPGPKTQIRELTFNHVINQNSNASSILLLRSTLIVFPVPQRGCLVIKQVVLVSKQSDFFLRHQRLLAFHSLLFKVAFVWNKSNFAFWLRILRQLLQPDGRFVERVGICHVEN